MARDPFTEVEDAFETAVTDMDDALGFETDPELEFYDSLTNDDFKAMMDEFGITGTTEWIKKMEAKRLGVEQRSV